MENDLLDEPFEFEITLGPWTLKPHPDTEGAYIINEARHEQLTWVTDGCDVSEEEGDRRNLIVERRDAGNVRLIRIAPELFKALRNLLLFPDAGKDRAVEVLKSIGPNWETLVTINQMKEERTCIYERR